MRFSGEEGRSIERFINPNVTAESIPPDTDTLGLKITRYHKHSCF